MLGEKIAYVKDFILLVNNFDLNTINFDLTLKLNCEKKIEKLDSEKLEEVLNLMELDEIIEFKNNLEKLFEKGLILTNITDKYNSIVNLLNNYTKNDIKQKKSI